MSEGPAASADPNQAITDLLPRVAHILGRRIAGIYLFGSLVLGDFEPGVSDIDLLVAVHTPITRAEHEALGQMHRAFAAEFPEWDDRLDVYYAALESLQHPARAGIPLSQITPGDGWVRTDSGPHWLINWWQARERSVTLAGPPPGEIIASISTAQLVACVRHHAAQWPEWVLDHHERKQQAYAILTLCRAMYTVEHGDQVSKPQAADWAATRHPYYSALIRSSVDWRKAWRDPADGLVTYDATVEFVHFAASQIQHHTAAEQS